MLEPYSLTIILMCLVASISHYILSFYMIVMEINCSIICNRLFKDGTGLYIWFKHEVGVKLYRFYTNS